MTSPDAVSRLKTSFPDMNATMAEILAQAQILRMEMGEELSHEICPPFYWVILLEGKIRLLETDETDGGIHTRTILEPGDVWNASAWRLLDINQNPRWFVAEPTRLG